MFPRRTVFALSLCALTLAAAPPDGAALWKARCAGCHEGSTPQLRMPKRDEVAARTPENVYNAMATGAMTVQAAGLSEDEERAIATYVTGKTFGSAAPEAIAGMCTTPPRKFAPSAKADWNGWGVDPANSRFQPNPGLKADDVAKLKLKWAFGFPGDNSAAAQPTVVGGRVFVGSNKGIVYSLDQATGCIIWSHETGAGVRTAMTVEPSKTPGKYIVFYGDLRSSAHALNAETGKELWKTKVEDHTSSRITGAPTFFNGTLYVPVSSIEEASAMSDKYECCKFQGSLVALDGETGTQKW